MRVREGTVEGLESRRILVVEVLRTLQENEVAQGVFTKGQERQLDCGRVVFGALREIWPAKMGHAANRRQEVARLCEMEHLLHGEAGDDTLPAPHGLELLGCQALFNA